MIKYDLALALLSDSARGETDEGFTACCPAHDDESPSLSVRNKDGRASFKCYAGCDFHEIENALDPVMATYTYRDENGTTIFVKERTQSKEFRLYQIDRDGNRVNNLNGCRRVPYGLTELVEGSGDLYVVEGEKDADRLGSLGLSATTNFGGANAQWPADEWEPVFQRFDRVIILCDNDEPGRRYGRKCAAEASRFCSDVRLIEELPGVGAKGDVSDWIEAGNDIADLTSLVESAPLYENETDESDSTGPDCPFIEELNRRFAVLTEDPPGAILYTQGDRVVLIDRTRLNTLLENRRPPQGKRAADYWLQHEERREYSRVVFEPLSPSEGFVATRNAYNTFRKWGVEPKAGDCSRFLQHVRNVVCSGNVEMSEWLMKWLAHAVQRPRELPQTAPILIGKQGCGKGQFVRYVAELFGPHFVNVNSTDELTGRFNQKLADKLLIFADEASWGGEKQREGRLKAMITEPTLTFEEKYSPPITLRNYSRIIFASNEDWPVAVGSGDRRYVLFEVSDECVGDHTYFEALAAERYGGGPAALLHELLSMNLDGWKPQQRPLDGNSWRLKQQTFDAHDSKLSFLYAILCNGELPLRRGSDGSTLVVKWPGNGDDGVIEKDELYSAYEEHCRSMRARKVGNALFFDFLKRNAKVVKPNDGPQKRRGNLRIRTVVLKPLAEARALYCELVREGDHIWEDGIDANEHDREDASADF